MQRRQFLAGATLMLMGLNSWAASTLAELPRTPKMPVLFLGHGSPMNAIEDSPFRRTWQQLGQTLPRPSAILVISAHWLSDGETQILTTAQPATIHDFGGFPRALFAQRYPAQGALAAAQLTQTLLQQVPDLTVSTDAQRGLDHGVWSVLLPMYPAADIPVYQLSIDFYQPAAYHYALGQQLAALRERGVMVIGSGNLVHNLRVLGSDRTAPYDWALEFDQKMEQLLAKHDDQGAIALAKPSPLMQLSHPTPDHLWPLYYVLGAKTAQDEVRMVNDQFDGNAISMRSVVYS